MSFQSGAYQDAVATLNPAGAPHPSPGDATFTLRVRPVESVFLMKMTDMCDIPNGLVVQVRLPPSRAYPCCVPFSLFCCIWLYVWRLTTAFAF